MYLRILVTRLKNFGILNLYIMATMKKSCPPGQHMVNGICTPKPLSSVGAKIGVGTVLAGGAAMIGTAIKNTIKRKKLEKAEEEKKKAAEEAKKMSMKKMGGAKKYQPGGPVYQGPVSKSATDKINKEYSTNAGPRVYNQDIADADELKKMRENYDRIPAQKRGGATKKYMTGGMVNSNAKVSALKSAGSKGVKSGVNAKAKASTTAKGRTGGTSKAPKGATPTKNKRG
jgi:hypothetical protein